MVHDIRLIGKKQQTTSRWAGGTTTQLAIYPEDGSYGDRDFIWRLSSAEVEVEDSVFTKLPGFDRVLMVLDGELRLVHREHNTIGLKQFEQASFKGEWDTISYGKARDFNLMLKEGLEGSIKHCSVLENMKFHEPLKVQEDKKGHYALFVYKGTVKVNIGIDEYEMTEGDLLVFQWQGAESISIVGFESSENHLITACIFI